MNISTVSPSGNDWQASSLRNSPALEGVSGTKSAQMAADAATQNASKSRNANNSNSGDTIDFSTEFPSLDAISRRVMETMQRVLEQMAREAAEREAERAAREEARREDQVAAQRAAQAEQLQQQSQAAQQRDLQVAAPILGTANAPGAGSSDNRSRDKKQVVKHQQTALAASASIQGRAHTLAPPREMVQHIRQSIQKLSKAEALVLHQFKPAASAFIA